MEVEETRTTGASPLEPLKDEIHLRRASVATLVGPPSAGGSRLQCWRNRRHTQRRATLVACSERISPAAIIGCVR